MTNKIKLFLLNEVSKRVKQEKNYIPRNYETVGGMWTVDRWEKNGVVYRLMDEGYTTRISCKESGLDVLETMHGIEWKSGDIDALLIALQKVMD